MTSIRKLDRRLWRWIRYTNRVVPGWSLPRSEARIPAGLERAAFRLDQERLRRHLVALTGRSGVAS